MSTTIKYNLEDLPTIVTRLKDLMQNYRIFAFTGSLGAGKTTLVRSLLQACGVTGVISSPTFTYINIYTVDSKGNDPYAARGERSRIHGGKEVNYGQQKFYHFDLYRITNPQEFVDAGFDEYLNDPQAYVFIEWPEVINSLLSRHVCFVELEYMAENERSITLSCN